MRLTFTLLKKRTQPCSGRSRATTRQLAAARLVVQGLSSSEVARRIGTIRQTINRWKRLPAFGGEVRRLHEMLAVHYPAAPAAKELI